MSGPLSRLRFSSEILLVEDEDSIPWTYVSTAAESTQDDAIMYTSEGAANKRRRTYRKKKQDFEVGPSSSGPDSPDWTEEEELSLCQVVALCLQQASAHTNSSTSLQTEVSPAALENGQARELLSTDITTELQRLSISKLLAGCFVPSREYGDVVARVKSGTFRRTFIGFLQGKARRSRSLLCRDSAEEINVEMSGDSNAESREMLHVEGQNGGKSASFTATGKRPSARERSRKVRSDQQTQLSSPSQTRQGVRTEGNVKSAEMDVKFRGECSIEPQRGMEQGEIQLEQPIPEDKRSEKFQPPNRSTSQLKNKRHYEEHLNGKGAATCEEDNTDLVRQISPSSPDNKDDLNLPRRMLDNRPNSQCINEDKNRPLVQEEVQATKTNINDTLSQLSTHPTKTENQKRNRKQRQKRKQEGGVQRETTELKQPSTKVLAQLDDTTAGNTKSKRFTVKNVQKAESVPRQSEKNCSEHEETTANIHHPQVTGSDKARLLATVQPLRNSQNVKDVEKRSFKTFRKKFLDRCLEVQHGGLALTAKLPGRRGSESSRVPANLDECLAMQQVQQSRKSVLDACLTAQKDVS